MNRKEIMEVKIKLKKWHNNLIRDNLGNVIKNDWNNICFEEITKLKLLIDE